MARFKRAAPAAFILAIGLSASACSSSGHSFDPSDLIPNNWFGTDEKLPGERKPVFPEGVPGVSDGVPAELIKGHQQAAVDEQPAPAAGPPASAKPAPAARAQPAKPKPQARTASTQQAQPRAAAPAQPAQQSGQSEPAWPDPATGAQPAASSSPAAWPPPDANTFSR